MIEVPVLYLDIDGTVRKGYDELGRWVNHPDDVEVFPEARSKMADWVRGKPGRIVGITNQGGIGLGLVPREAVLAALQETQRQCNHLFDMIKVCPHKPDDQNCSCRKPAPGLVYKARIELQKMNRTETYPSAMSLFVGDRPEDKACAEAAGIPFMDAAEWRAS